MCDITECADGIFSICGLYISGMLSLTQCHSKTRGVLGMQEYVQQWALSKGLVSPIFRRDLFISGCAARSNEKFFA